MWGTIRSLKLVVDNAGNNVYNTAKEHEMEKMIGRVQSIAARYKEDGDSIG